MSNYNTIYHPILNKKIEIKSKTAKKLLKRYIKLLGGSIISDPNIKNNNFLSISKNIHFYLKELFFGNFTFVDSIVKLKTIQIPPARTHKTDYPLIHNLEIQDKIFIPIIHKEDRKKFPDSFPDLLGIFDNIYPDSIINYQCTICQNPIYIGQPRVENKPKYYHDYCAFNIPKLCKICFTFGDHVCKGRDDNLKFLGKKYCPKNLLHLQKKHHLKAHLLKKHHLKAHLLKNHLLKNHRYYQIQNQDHMKM